MSFQVSKYSSNAIKLISTTLNSKRSWLKLGNFTLRGTSIFTITFILQGVMIESNRTLRLTKIMCQRSFMRYSPTNIKVPSIRKISKKIDRIACKKLDS